MRHLSPIPIVIALVLAACGAAGSTSPSASASEMAPTASAAASAGAGSADPSVPPTAEPVPSDELGEFSCEFPLVEDATTARANIRDVRVGTHPDFDRIVFEFAQGLPEMTLDTASPPFTHDASGMPIEVDGEAFLRLTMRGGTKQTEDGTSSYDGPTEFDPGFPTLVQLAEGGDFEAQSTWYIGMSDAACARVILLEDAGGARLVIDLEH